MRLSLTERLVLRPFGAAFLRWGLLGFVAWLALSGRVVHPVLVLMLVFVAYNAPGVTLRRIASRIVRACERGQHAERLALVERMAGVQGQLDPGMARLYFDALIDASEMERARAVLADAGNMGGPETTDQRLTLARDWLVAGDGALAMELLNGLGNLPFPDQEVSAALARAEACLWLDRAADAQAALPAAEALAKLPVDARTDALTLAALVCAARDDVPAARATAAQAADLSRPGHPRHPPAQVAASWAAVEGGEVPGHELALLEPLEGRLPPAYRALRQLMLARAHEQRGEAGKDAARTALAAALALPLFPFAKRRAEELAARVGPVSPQRVIERARDHVSRADRAALVERLVAAAWPARIVSWALIGLGALAIQREAVTNWFAKPVVVAGPTLALGFRRWRYLRNAPQGHFSDRRYEATLALLDYMDEVGATHAALEHLELRSYAQQRLGELGPHRWTLARLREAFEQELPMADWPAEIRQNLALWYAGAMDPHRVLEALQGIKRQELTRRQTFFAIGAESGAHLDLGRPGEARPCAEQCVELAEEPDQKALALIDLALVQLELGLRDEARATAKRADELAPDSAPDCKMLVAIERAIIELECGATDGDTWLARLAQVEPQLATYFPATRARHALAQALAHVAAGRPDQARPLVQKALAAPMQDNMRRRAQALVSRMA